MLTPKITINLDGSKDNCGASGLQKCHTEYNDKKVLLRFDNIKVIGF